MKEKLSNILEKSEVVFPYLDKPVEVYKLENGHTIVLAHKAGELVNVSTWVKTGSINENDQITGISHFLEHLMFKGTPKHPAGEFDRILEAKGAIVNAATWKDYTFYYVTLPKGENDIYFKQALELHADMMINASLPEEEIGMPFDCKCQDSASTAAARERCVVIEEIRMRNDQPWTKIYDELNNLMYTEHPYRRDVIGTAEVISSVSRQTIDDYYKKWYTPDNMTTIIVGEMNSAEVIDEVRKHFAFEPTAVSVKKKHKSEPEQTQPRYFEQTGNYETGFMITGFHGPKAENLKDSIALDVISIVLGEGNSSRLYQNLIEKPAKPVFNVVATTQYQFKDGNTFFVQANFRPEKKDMAKELVRNELRNIVDFPISEEELCKARKKLKSNFAEESETVSEIGESIGHYMTVCGNISCYADYLKTLETLTAQDVLQAAKEYLDLNKVSISILVPEK
jgi:zinc protease